MATISCPHCGTPNRGGSKFCNECGVTLHDHVEADESGRALFCSPGPARQRRDRGGDRDRGGGGAVCAVSARHPSLWTWAQPGSGPRTRLPTRPRTGPGPALAKPKNGRCGCGHAPHRRGAPGRAASLLRAARAVGPGGDGRFCAAPGRPPAARGDTHRILDWTAKPDASCAPSPAAAWPWRMPSLPHANPRPRFSAPAGSPCSSAWPWGCPCCSWPPARICGLTCGRG